MRRRSKSLQVVTAITRCNALRYIIIMTESRRIIRDVLPSIWRQTRLSSIFEMHINVLCFTRIYRKVRRCKLHTHVHARACTRVCVCASNSLCMWVSCMCPSALLFAALPANLIELSRYQRNCRNHTVFRGSWLMISQKAGFSFVLALYL